MIIHESWGKNDVNPLLYLGIYSPFFLQPPSLLKLKKQKKPPRGRRWAWYPSGNCWPPWPGLEKGNWMVTLKTCRFISQRGQRPPPKKICFQIYPSLWVSKMPPQPFPSIFQVSWKTETASLRSRWLKPGVCCRKKKKKRTEKKRISTWSLWCNSVERLSLWLALLLQQSTASGTHLQVHYSRVQHLFFLSIHPPLHQVSMLQSERDPDLLTWHAEVTVTKWKILLRVEEPTKLFL